MVSKDIRAVANQLIHTCHSAGQPIDSALATLVIQHIRFMTGRSLNPKKLAEVEFNQLVKAAAKLLLAQDDPATHSIRLCHWSQIAISERADFRTRFRADHQTRCVRTFDKISRERSTDVIWEDMLNLCFSVCFPLEIVLPSESRHLNPALKPEITAAVDSVLPREEAILFRDMVLADPSTGPKNIGELADIVAGIRLLNSTAIADAEEITNSYKQLLSDTTQIQDDLGRIVSLAYNPVIACHTFLHAQRFHHVQTFTEFAKPSDISHVSDTDLTRLLAENVNRRMLVTTVGHFRLALSEALTEIQTAQTEFNGIMAEVHRLIAGRDSVPKGEIYPKFVEASQVYQTLSELTSLLAIFRRQWRVIINFVDDMVGPVSDINNVLANIHAEQVSGDEKDGVGESGEETGGSHDQLTGLRFRCTLNPKDIEPATRWLSHVNEKLGPAPKLIPSSAENTRASGTITAPVAFQGVITQRITNDSPVLPKLPLACNGLCPIAATRKGWVRFGAVASSMNENSRLGGVMRIGELIFAFDDMYELNEFEAHPRDAISELFEACMRPRNVMGLTQKDMEDLTVSPMGLSLSLIQLYDLSSVISKIESICKADLAVYRSGGSISGTPGQPERPLTTFGTVDAQGVPSSDTPIKADIVFSLPFVTAFKSVYNSELVARAASLLGNTFDVTMLASAEEEILLGDTTRIDIKKDMGVGTPIHFVESHIDPKYESSQWKLRQQALKLAKLTRMATHSSQTNDTHFRRTQSVQKSQMVSSVVQTKKDSGTSAIKPVRDPLSIVGSSIGANKLIG